MKILSIEEAVRKMTSFPAQKLGMRDRGMIRESMVADLVVFDPDTISDKCTYANPHQYPVGIPYVIVSGEVVVNESKHTGAFPGRSSVDPLWQLVLVCRDTSCRHVLDVAKKRVAAPGLTWVDGGHDTRV